VASYDKALTLNPEFSRAWYSRGVAFSRLGEHTIAITNFDHALGINPSYLDAARRRRISLRQLKHIVTRPPG
jgi:tetratricopeptide (TPR) repeat protein